MHMVAFVCVMPEVSDLSVCGARIRSQVIALAKRFPTTLAIETMQEVRPNGHP